MKNATLPFLLMAFLLVFIACEKETFEPPVSIQPELTSLASVKEVVIFHVGQEDMATGGQSGILIDKYGFVRKYNFTESQASELPKKEDWLEEDVYYLLNNASAIVTQLEDEEVLEFYKKIKSARTGVLSAITQDGSQPVTQSYHAFVAKYEENYSNDDGSCSVGCGINEYEELNYTAVLMRMTGAVQQINEHSDAAKITEWLDGFVVEAGL